MIAFQNYSKQKLLSPYMHTVHLTFSKLYTPFDNSVDPDQLNPDEAS